VYLAADREIFEVFDSSSFAKDTAVESRRFLGCGSAASKTCKSSNKHQHTQRVFLV